MHETKRSLSVPERWRLRTYRTLVARCLFCPLGYKYSYFQSTFVAVASPESALSPRIYRFGPGGALALAKFAADDDPVAAHGAAVTGVADGGATVADHGARVDGWGKVVLFELGDLEGLG